MAKIPETRIPKHVPVEAIRKIEQQRNGTITEATRCKVESQGDSDVANVILRKLTAGIRVVNERFHEILAPHNEAIRQTRALRSEILAPLETSKTNLTQRLMNWRAEEQRRITEEKRKVEEENQRLEEKRQAEEERRRKIQAAHAAKGHETKPLEAVPEPEPVPEPVPLAATDTTKVRKVWDFEIINAEVVPDEYKVIDEKLIRKAIFANRDENGVPQIEIPGVNIFQKETPVFA